MNARLLLRLLASGLVLIFVSGRVHAEEIDDPTRPPVAFLNPAAVAAVPAMTTGVASVKIGPGKKRSAIINGMAVSLGDAVGDATLVGVSENGAVLRHADGTLERLFIYESIEKRMVPPPADGAGRKMQRGQ